MLKASGAGGTSVLWSRQCVFSTGKGNRPDISAELPIDDFPAGALRGVDTANHQCFRQSFFLLDKQLKPFDTLLAPSRPAGVEQRQSTLPRSVAELNNE
jgi:hypothetical protein